MQKSQEFKPNGAPPIPDAAGYATRIAQALDGARSGDGWLARCPAHDDGNPSLSVTDSEDGSKPLVHCHAGCTQDAVIAALKAKNLWLQPTSRSQAFKIVATYDYTDEKGRVLFQTVRYKPKDFRQRRPDGHGGWIWNLTGIRRVLYPN